jgi:hypothetical protein
MCAVVRRTARSSRSHARGALRMAPAIATPSVDRGFSPSADRLGDEDERRARAATDGAVLAGAVATLALAGQAAAAVPVSVRAIDAVPVGLGFDASGRAVATWRGLMAERIKPAVVAGLATRVRERRAARGDPARAGLYSSTSRGCSGCRRRRAPLPATPSLGGDRDPSGSSSPSCWAGC